MTAVKPLTDIEEFNRMNAIQFITDAEGNRISAVIPIELFNKLAAESELDVFFEPVPYEADDNDDETIPGAVVDIRHENNVPLHGAYIAATRKSMSPKRWVLPRRASPTWRKERSLKGNA